MDNACPSTCRACTSNCLAPLSPVERRAPWPAVNSAMTACAYSSYSVPKPHTLALRKCSMRPGGVPRTVNHTINPTLASPLSPLPPAPVTCSKLHRTPISTSCRSSMLPRLSTVAPPTLSLAVRRRSPSTHSMVRTRVVVNSLYTCRTKGKVYVRQGCGARGLLVRKPTAQTPVIAGG